MKKNAQEEESKNTSKNSVKRDRMRVSEYSFIDRYQTIFACDIRVYLWCIGEI